MNGIPLAFLDGIDDNETNQLVSDVLRGYDDDTIENIDTLINGYDLVGFKGDGSVDDSEKLRSYILRTKVVAEKYPQSVREYQNPEQFAKMLGYVLQHWDSANRESALEAMANEEERLIGLGQIKIDLADDAEDVELGDDIADDDDDFVQIGTVATAKGVAKVVKSKKGKVGFFRSLKKLNNNANISASSNDVVNSNPFLNKIKNSLRKKIAESRKTKKTYVKNPAVKRAKVITQNVATDVKGLDGFDTDIQALLGGYDFYENLNGDNDQLKTYLQRTKRVLENNSDELFSSRNQEDVVLGEIDYVLKNYDNKEALNCVLSGLSGDGMDDEQYHEFIQGIGRAKRQQKMRSFFKALKKAKKDNSNKSLRKATAINPFVAPVAKKAVKINNERQLNGVASMELLGCLNGVDATKTVLKNTLEMVRQNPSLYVDDQYEYENTVGMLGYAIKNWNDEKVVDQLCGLGMTGEQYEDLQDELGAVVAKTTLPIRKALKKANRKSKRLSAMRKSYAMAATNSIQKKKLAERLAEAQKHQLGKKFFKKVGTAIKKTGSAVKNAAKKTGQAVKTAAKKTGQAIKKAVKKIVKFVIKYNPVTLVTRAIILMACRLNMFNMSERMHPATLSETEAAKLGLSAEQYKASKDAYAKLLKSFTKIGGKESKLKTALEKGSKKVWKGGDTFSVATLKATALQNKKNIDSQYNEDEAELKKAGATSTNDPNVTYSETRQEVEVAVNGILGLIENGYIVNGLGVVTEATVASGAASAGGILAKILGGLKKVFASGKVRNAVKNFGSKVKNTVSNIKTNRQQKIASGEKTPLKDRIKNFTSNAKDTVKNIASSPTAQNVKESAKNAATTAAASILNKYNGEATETNDNQNGSNDGGSKMAIIVGIGAIALLGVAGVIAYNKNNDK